MANTALNRTTVALLTNKSGGALAYGAVVVLDNTNAKGFTTTTTSGITTRGLGVIIEPNGIANDATGIVAISGWCPKVTLNTAATVGQFIKSHTVAGQGTPHDAPQVQGDFGVALQASATPEMILFGTPNPPTSGIPVLGSSTDEGLVRWDGTSGGTVQNTSAVTVSDTGVFTFPDNIRQTFNPGADASGLNVGSHAGNPGTPSNGDVWYNSSTEALMARVNGASLRLGDFVKIEESTPSATGTLTFSSLGTFTHLEIRWSARSTKAASVEEDMVIRFNADTGGNYDSLLLYNPTATTAAASEVLAGTSARVGTLPAASADASRGGGGIIRIHDYRGTTFFKTAEGNFSYFQGAALYSSTRPFGVHWRSASAITSITILLASGNYVAGSKFTLYGLN